MYLTLTHITVQTGHVVRAHEPHTWLTATLLGSTVVDPLLEDQS